MNKYKSSFNGTGRAYIGNIRNNVKQCQTYKVIVTMDKEQSLLYVCHASPRKSRKKLILGYQAELWK